MAYERFVWFHREIKRNRYPNANKLAQRFEISQKQAQRDIEFLRDRLNAPLKYDHRRHGYYYSETSFELPSVWINEDELLSLCIASRLAKSIPQDEIKESLINLFDKLSENLASHSAKFKDFLNKVSVKNIEYYRIDKSIFRQVCENLFHQRNIEFDYFSPHTKEKTRRIVKPLHLLSYMGRWFLIGYCAMKRDLRYFSLSRMSNIVTAKAEIDYASDCELVRRLTSNFGILHGDEPKEVCIKFSPQISDWIREQVWHESQEISEDRDGWLILKFKAANFAELKGEILKFGSYAKVIDPEELREAIKHEIEQMKDIYR